MTGDKLTYTNPLVFMWRAGGVQKGWDNSNAHTNDLQYIYYEPVQIKTVKNAVHEFTKCKTPQSPH